jgi:two-component sensor histidine kinase
MKSEPTFTKTSRSKWPLIAIALVLMFIAVDLILVNSTRTIRDQVNSDNGLIEQLGQIESAVLDLPKAKQEIGWKQAVSSLNGSIEGIDTAFPDDRDIQVLIPRLNDVIDRMDSLHTDSRRTVGNAQAAQRNEAIMSVIGKHGSDLVADAARSIRKNRLEANINALSTRWNSVQALLLIACLFAIFMAFVIAKNERLLRENIEKQAEIQQGKRELEQTNKELRETMLSKEEKEVMIKEIHHRVKNNLQIVKSLIRFQMYTVSDQEINEKFNECVNRVSAMALVHEQTYLSKDLANIDVNGYLDQLTKDLIYAYNIDMPVEMDVDIEVPTLTVDTLVPLGLLLNEVISNSFKHAFKGRQKGTITVKIRGSEEFGLDVLMGDDGIGLPDRSQWSNHQSLGMDLIHTLTEQLDGTIALQEGAGTMYHLRTKGAEGERQQRA